MKRAVEGTHIDHNTLRWDCTMSPGKGERPNVGCGAAGATNATLNGLFIERALPVVNYTVTERSKQVDGEYL
jgi:hypothetical protein